MTSAEVAVGIDLGTTYSAVAYADATGMVEILVNKEGSNTTPSVLLREGDRFIVGQEAAAQAVLRAEDIVRCIKREMGKPFLFQGQFSPEQLSAKILEKLVEDASEVLGSPVRRAVITVPAYFVEPQKAATRKAGELAGLDVLSLLPEPEAAALHFGITRLADDESVLVCDLGGGTYDATILKREEGLMKAVNTCGSRILGGHDWTMALADLLAERIEDETDESPKQNLKHWQLLCDRAEELKRLLSKLPTTDLAWNHDGEPLKIPVTRDEFEECTQTYLDEVLNKTAEAIKGAGLECDQITHVVLVGGSSRLPKFVDEIARITGKTPRRTRNPDEAVARGAAMVARGIVDGKADREKGRITVISGAGKSRKIIEIQRRTHHALGTMTYQLVNGQVEYINETIIPANTDIPVSVPRGGFQLAAKQETFQVPVLQLDSAGNQQEILGNYRFHADPPPDKPTKVTVQFRYDFDEIVSVTAYTDDGSREFPGERQPFEPPKVSDRPPVEPGTVVLCIDCSGSMSGSKLQEAKQLLHVLAQKYANLGGNWSISVVNFGGPYDIYPSKILLPPTKSVDALQAASDQLRVGGGTPMDAGLENIRNVLETATGKRLAILLTDGAPNDRHQSEQTAQTLKTLQITIATVPIGNDADREFLRRIGDLESDIAVDSSGAGMTDAVLDLLQKV